MDVDGRLNTVTFALVRSIYRNKSFQAFSDVLRVRLAEISQQAIWVTVNFLAALSPQKKVKLSLAVLG
jgi:hypothetical protein